MLDLAVRGEMLRKFLLRDHRDRRVGAKQNGAGRCRSLIDGKDVSRHAFSLKIVGGPQRPSIHQRLTACASSSFAPERDKCCSRRSHDVIVLTSSIETVIGPTPPGTGVI